MEIKNKIKDWLLWSQKYTQTDMLYVAKGGFWLFIGQAVGFLANFLLIIIFTNWLSKETFGTYKYVLSLLGILSIPSLSGLNSAVLNAASKNEDGSFLRAFQLKLKWGLWGTLASLIVAGYYFFQGNNALSICFLIVACFLPFFNSFSLYDSFLAGKKKFDLQNKLNILVQIVSLSAMAFTLFFTNNIFLILLAYFLPLTLCYIIFFILVKKKFQFNNQASKETLAFGKHLSLLGGLANLNSQVDKIILWHFLGPAPLAIYSVVMMMPDKIKEILKIIGSLAMPKLVVRPILELKKTIPQKTLQLFALSFPIMILYILIVPLVFKWFFPQYVQYVMYSQFYALILLTYPRILSGSVLTAKQKTKELYIGALVLSPVYWVLLLVLTPTLGIWGAIASFLLLEFITFILQYWQFKRIT
ncbi:MAG: oligosaccharide flippase family protein [Candidatus Pacebacteria bacterium]|nr:oligosaccharide flippase family protein [Candidatus Paceibacterota bacterium]